MSANLMASLGLDQVSADPNKVPDNTYDCFVADVDYAYSTGKNVVGHVINYQIEDGPHKGSRISHWFSVGSDPVYDANGTLTNFRPTMSDGQKTWYKKAFVDLGMPEDQVGVADPKSLIGTKCTVKVQTSAQDSRYQNVTQVNLRSGATAAPINSEFSAPSPATAAPQAPAADLASQL